MTTKQKCEKLAQMLETVAEKLRDPRIGAKVWENDEPRMQNLLSNIGLFLKKAMDVSSDDLPSSAKKKSSKDMTDEESKDYDILNNWPDILS